MTKNTIYRMSLFIFLLFGAILLWLSINVIQRPETNVEIAGDGQTAAIYVTPYNLTPSSSPTDFLPTIDVALPTNTPTTTPASTTPIPTSTVAAATPTAIAPTVTPLPWFERQIIGYSVQQRPVELIRLGSGPHWFILLGALHGGQECHTSDVVEGILNYFMAEPQQLPTTVTLYAVPLINQDGCSANTRANVNGVDLNRNWDTPDWQTDAEAASGVIPGAGGSHPFSEPETQLLRDLLIGLRNAAPQRTLIVISYHSAVPQTGLVQPGYIGPNQPGFVSAQLAQQYSRTTGYLYSTHWVGNYTITGELIHWANLQNIVAMDVELPDRGAAHTIPVGWSETHVETNLRGVLDLLNDQESRNGTE